MIDPLTVPRRRIAIVGPVFPYRAGIAYCTTELAARLEEHFDVLLFSYRRQYPRALYPGSSDIDETLRHKTPERARFVLDIVNPWSWVSEALYLRRSEPDVVILVWWVWVWALPCITIMALLGRRTRFLLQCHNVSDKEPARWKSALTNAVFGRADAFIVHAESDREELLARSPRAAGRVSKLFLPVHALGGAIPSREAARQMLGVPQQKVALFFGHVRPFKGLDIALVAWSRLGDDVLLLVTGEVWWNDEGRYRELARSLGIEARVRFDFRFIPDSEIATCFAAADVVVAPYRSEAQSGVMLTAFHFSRPVIATRVGGIPEVLEDGVNGLLIEPENPLALAEAVEKFFTSADRPAMEAAAAATASRCSWQEYAAGVARSVDGILDSAG